MCMCGVCGSVLGEEGRGGSHLVSSNEDGAGVRVEEEGGGGLGKQWLTAIATLQTQLVLDVPHTQLLWMCEGVSV